MPLTVGGGITSVEDMTQLMKAGADKISINTAAMANPALITEGAQKFGNQGIVVCLDVKYNPFEKTWYAYIMSESKVCFRWKHGQKITANDLVLALNEAYGLGPGQAKSEEVMLYGVEPDSRYKSSKKRRT